VFPQIARRERHLEEVFSARCGCRLNACTCEQKRLASTYSDSKPPNTEGSEREPGGCARFAKGYACPQARAYLRIDDRRSLPV